MYALESGGLRLLIDEQNGYFFTTEVETPEGWLPASRSASRPVDALPVTEVDGNVLSGANGQMRWQTTIHAANGGFLLATVVNSAEKFQLNPALILWINGLDNLNDRQAHTWRQTILRAPTVNQQGLPGNDLPGCYIYDHATRIETIFYTPPEAFAWSPHRFYNFTLREVLSYRPSGRYGMGLIPNAPDMVFDFEAGEHHFVWWFTQRHREDVPTSWDAQRTLIQTLAPLLNPVPQKLPNTISWQLMAESTLEDLYHEACWTTKEGETGLRAYVRGSSAVGRDDQPGFELMTQLDVLHPLLLWRKLTGNDRADAIIERLQKTIPLFYRPALNFVTNNFPPHPGDSFMDTWYFLENALIKLPWVAHLSGDAVLMEMFFTALKGAETLAQRSGGLFPLFADAQGWQSKPSLLNVGVAGLYAAGCVMAYQLGGQDRRYLLDAAQALRTMHQLPPHLLTHEPQQLTFAAAAARFLMHHAPETGNDWRQIAADFVYLTLRMGYWGSDPAVPFYDPRGMFQACASLCYPAYKENVEVLMAFPELLRDSIGPVELMSAFAGLQRSHNYAFFDLWLPEDKRRGDCLYVPWEDLATAEFTHTAALGKELYGAGEVFWSALLFATPAGQEDADLTWLSLDVPCLTLPESLPAAKKRYLVYNPLPEARTVHFMNQLTVLPGRTATTIGEEASHVEPSP